LQKITSFRGTYFPQTPYGALSLELLGTSAPKLPDESPSQIADPPAP